MSEGNLATVGALLKNKRLSLEISLPDIAARTRIRRVYLEALEDDRFDLLPGEVYVGGFLRIYSEVLGLNPTDMCRQYREQSPPQQSEVEPKSKPVRSRRFFGVIVAGCIIFAVFLVFKKMESSPASTVVHEEIVDRPATAEDRQVPDPPAPDHAGSAITSEPIAPSVPPLPAIPVGGAVITLKANGPGLLELVLDEDFHQRYDLKGDVELSWKVNRSARLTMDNPAAVTVWLDQEKIDPGERSELVFLPSEGLVKD